MSSICRINRKVFFILSFFLIASYCFLIQAGEVPTTTTIREDGALVIDGKPVFPIGIETGGVWVDHLERYAEAGFNMVRTQPDFPVVFPDFYDNAYQKHHLYILGGHYTWATFAGGDKTIDFLAKEKAGMDLAFSYLSHGRRPLEILKTLDRKPGVIGWQIAEGPGAKFAEPLEFTYEIFKSYSPDHIVTIIAEDPVWYHVFYNACDVLIIDHYPFRGQNSQPLIDTYFYTRHAVEVMKEKPVWFMAQMFNFGYDWAVYEPTYDQEISLSDYEQQVYLALIAGARGIWFFTGAGLLKGIKDAEGKDSQKIVERRWQALSAVVGEIKELSPILIDGRTCNPDEIRLEWKRPGVVFHKVIEHYGKKYLLVANIGETEVGATVMGTNYGNFGAYQVSVFIDGSKRLDATGQEIIIKPHGAGVFLLTRRPVTPPAFSTIK